MRGIILSCTVAAVTFVGASALACGGGFGNDVTIRPDQTIVVTHRNGEETYVFRPHFCGKASEFGLILPIPAPLLANPALTASTLFEQVEAMTAPRIEKVDVCTTFGFMGSADKAAIGGRGPEYSVDDDGVDVVAAGTVGMFSWELLKADTARNFTDWLDAKQFAYPASAGAAFDHYVRAGYYFVAFQVTASDKQPRDGYRICGDFGPIELSFVAEQPVIPARIATAANTGEEFYWRVISIAAHEMRVSNGPEPDSFGIPALTFAGQLTSDQLQRNPAVAAIANAGEWITRLNLTFSSYSLEDDFHLVESAVDEPYREVIYEENEVDCGVFGCSIVNRQLDARWLFALGVAFGIPTALARMRRVRRRAR